MLAGVAVSKSWTSLALVSGAAGAETLLASGPWQSVVNCSKISGMEAQNLASLECFLILANE